MQNCLSETAKTFYGSLGFFSVSVNFALICMMNTVDKTQPHNHYHDILLVIVFKSSFWNRRWLLRYDHDAPA